MGMLDGLDAFGLGGLKNIETLYAEDEKKAQEETAEAVKKKSEQDFLMDKDFECPVCQRKFKQRVARTTLKCVKHDLDLRPVFDGIDATKYDVIFCTECGYAVLTRFYAPLAPTHRKLLTENIRKAFKPQPNVVKPLISYEEAVPRFKMALANAVVKQAKSSEKAYICLKTAWLYRGMGEKLEAEGGSAAEIEGAKKAERECLVSAAEGLIKARATETAPYAGMNATTLDYLIAAIYLETDTNLKDGARLLQEIITSRTATSQNKEKARELLEMIKEKIGE